jgi:hypothetical protein
VTSRRRILLGVALLAAAAVIYFLSRPSSSPPRQPDAAAISQTPSPAKPPEPPASPQPTKAAQPAPSAPPPVVAQAPLPVHRPQPLKLNFDSGPYQRQSDGTIFKNNDIERARQLHLPGNPPEDDIAIIDTLVNTYRKIFRENPVAGENWEVVDALTGENEFGLVFLDPAHPAINEDGELTDRWGTPFRFHALGSTIPIEISSAGPDLEFGTPDDVMIAEPAFIGDSGKPETE